MAIAPLIKLINKIPTCENKDISQLLQSAYKADEMAVVLLGLFVQRYEKEFSSPLLSHLVAFVRSLTVEGQQDFEAIRRFLHEEPITTDRLLNDLRYYIIANSDLENEFDADLSCLTSLSQDNWYDNIIGYAFFEYNTRFLNNFSFPFLAVQW